MQVTSSVTPFSCCNWGVLLAPHFPLWRFRYIYLCLQVLLTDNPRLSPFHSGYIQWCLHPSQFCRGRGDKSLNLEILNVKLKKMTGSLEPINLPLYMAVTLVCSIGNTREIKDGSFRISAIELMMGWALDENGLIIVTQNCHKDCWQMQSVRLTAEERVSVVSVDSDGFGMSPCKTANSISQCFLDAKHL